jgi:hypothetical protein
VGALQVGCVLGLLGVFALVRFNYRILNKEDAEAVLPWDVEHHDDTLRSSYIPHAKWVLLRRPTAFTINCRLFSSR